MGSDLTPKQIRDLRSDLEERERMKPNAGMVLSCAEVRALLDAFDKLAALSSAATKGGG